MPAFISIKGAKSNFFDQKVILAAASDAQIRVLSKFGAFVRRKAKSSIRKRKAASKPGEPPSSHKGQLKDFLFFSYDHARGSVVIGPAALNKPTGAPELLEYGGEVDGADRAIFVKKEAGRDKATGRFVKSGMRKVVLSGKFRVAARPFMGPALRAELPKFEGLWKDSIR